MTQVSPVVSTQYGPKEWLDLAQTQSSRALRKAVLAAFALANNCETAEIVLALIKRGELDPYLAAKKMVDYLIKERSRGTASVYRTLLFTFYRYAEVPIKDELFKLRVPPVKSGHSVNPPDVSKEDLRAVLVKAKDVHPMLQAFLEFLISTGWRVNEPFQVRVRDLTLEKSPGRVKLQAFTDMGELANKTGEPRESFLSSEAVRILKEHIALAKLKPDDPLFPIENKRKGQWAYHQIMRLLRELKLTQRGGYLDKWNFHPHTFRYINLGITKESRFPESQAETLAGHATGVKGVYGMIEKWAREWVQLVEPNMRFLDLEATGKIQPERSTMTRANESWPVEPARSWHSRRADTNNAEKRNGGM